MDTKTLITAEDFEHIAARLGPCELVRGEVITLSPGGLSHSQVTMNVSGLLWTWARRSNLGRILSGEPGVVVARGPDTVRGADVAYISYERIPQLSTMEGFIDVPPNLVVEIVGKGQGWRAMVEKAGEYLAMGVDRVWVIDPRTRQVLVFQPEAEPLALGMEDTVSDEAVLPGFTCKVVDFFAA